MNRRETRPRALLTIAGVLICAGCVGEMDPRYYPFVLRVESEVPGRVVARDIDGDRRDELVMTTLWARSPSEPGPGSTVLFRGDDGVAIDQINFAGFAQDAHVVDVDGDGSPEVLVPELRHDSLFASVSSPEGEKLFGFLLTTGRAREEVDGVLPWDPRVLGAWAIDTDGDGALELVTLISTDYARLPRGVFVHALPDGTELGRAVTGAAPRAWLMDDFDGDGSSEILVASQATNHGARAGGLDDSQSHLVLFSLEGGVHVAWSRRLSRQNVARIVRVPGEVPSSPDVLLVRGGPSLEGTLMDARSWEVKRTREFQDATVDVVAIDLDQDLTHEFVASRDGGGRIFAIDHELEVVARAEASFELRYGESWPDADEDGVDELVFSTASGLVFFDPDLTVKAIFDRGAITSVERRSFGRPARVVIADGETTVLATLTPNPLFLFYRHGGGILALMIVALSTTGVWSFRRDRRRASLFEAGSAHIMERGWIGLLIMDANGSMVWIHPRCHPDGVRASRLSLDVLGSANSDLARFCRVLLEKAHPAPQMRRMDSPVAPDGRVVQVEAAPIAGVAGPKTPWVVGIARSSGGEEGQLHAWPMMAQRVAHAIKNPLTHMLLTLQRLQSEYRERAPAIAGRLDPYSDRIVDGIGQLRRLTSSFLKVVDLAEPELEPVDVNGLISDFAEAMRSRIPPDIRLRVDPGPSIPRARLDREQIETALENLVTNSINALRGGGTITITSAACGETRFPASGRRASHLEIEVIDTGTGIRSDVRDRVFSPGVSSSDEGSGLGLAIVRKIVIDHGGDVAFSTEEGVGTVFTMRLPLDGPDT